MPTNAYQLVAADHETPEIKRFKFARLSGAVPDWAAGAHVRVALNGGDSRAYSLLRLHIVRIYRDFIFVRLAAQGLSFAEFFGEALSTIDNMVDRSPEGRLEIIASPIRYMHPCSWKMLVDNQTDTCHPMVAHESSAGTAVSVWEREKHNFTETPMAVQILRNFIPIAVDRTPVESFVFRLVGAPDKLYERAQEGHLSDGNEWIDLHRLYDADELPEDNEVVNSTSERQMRNQFHAWSTFMTMNMAEAVE
jgi:phenylpropionate dioxygenase-like ring-hydroxylating dioxygenase large terminal subunit